jgi:hypothetical protein
VSGKKSWIFHTRVCHADSAHDEPKSAFLGGEDVLDARAHAGSGCIAARDMGRHLLASGLLALKLCPQTAALEETQIGRRAVGGIGPYIAGGVVAIEHCAELAAVMRRRVRYTVAP